MEIARDVTLNNNVINKMFWSWALCEWWNSAGTSLSANELGLIGQMGLMCPVRPTDWWRRKMMLPNANIGHEMAHQNSPGL